MVLDELRTYKGTFFLILFLHSIHFILKNKIKIKKIKPWVGQREKCDMTSH